MRCNGRPNWFKLKRIIDFLVQAHSNAACDLRIWLITLSGRCTPSHFANSRGKYTERANLQFDCNSRFRWRISRSDSAILHFTFKFVELYHDNHILAVRARVFFMGKSNKSAKLSRSRWVLLFELSYSVKSSMDICVYLRDGHGFRGRSDARIDEIKIIVISDCIRLQWRYHRTRVYLFIS